jgi:hypothetical protein
MMKPNEPRICPAGCPYIDADSDPWGCENCRRDEDNLNAWQVDAEAAYDKKAQEDWDEN